jgi:hypothetical protein
MKARWDLRDVALIGWFRNLAPAILGLLDEFGIAREVGERRQS